MANEKYEQTALDLNKCGKGWESQREYCYWIPKTDIDGDIPKDLRGTLFRNGPGVHEVYGTRLKHRELTFWNNCYLSSNFQLYVFDSV